MNIFLSRKTALLLCASMYILAQVSVGYPEDWYEDTGLTMGSCTAQPTAAVPGAPHGSPTQDSSIIFTLSDTTGTATSGALCPESTYLITLSFGGASRLALLTANSSGVTFSAPSPILGCPNRVDLGGSSWTNAKTSYASTFKLSCSAAGTSITFRATSASKTIRNWKQNSYTVAVASAASPGACAAALDACAAGANTNLTASFPPPPVDGHADADDDDGGGDDDDDNKAAASTGGCDPSNLDYDCMATLGKVTVHWSVNTSSAPDNYCTPDVPTVLQASDLKQYGSLHVAVQAAVTGYVAIGFGRSPSKMYPADIVLGWASSGDPNQYIHTFHTKSSDLDEGDLDTSGWAYDKGVVHNSADGLTTICFSRRLVDSRATASPDLTPLVSSTQVPPGNTPGGRRRLLAGSSGGQLPLIWAISSKQELVQHKSSDVGGGHLNSNSVARGEYWVDVHGALMAVAWGLLLPLGTLLPAHRWLLRDAKMTLPLLGEKHVWFIVHVACQWSGLALFIAGFIVAFVHLEEGSGELGEAHKNIGIAIMAAAGAQVLVAYARPAPDSPRRGIWNLVHHNLGRVTVLLAWANVYIGIVVYHKDDGAEYREWITPIAVVMGLLAISDVVLRVNRPSKDSCQTAVAAADGAPQAGPMAQVAYPYGDPKDGAAATSDKAPVMAA